MQDQCDKRIRNQLQPFDNESRSTLDDNTISDRFNKTSDTHTVVVARLKFNTQLILKTSAFLLFIA